MTETSVPPRTGFIAGAWLDPLTFPFNSNFPTPDRMPRISMAGLPSIEARVKRLLTFLTGHPHITQLVAHSAGCLPIHACMDQLHGRGIGKVVLLNPAPLPGVKLDLGDPLFWMTLKYGMQLLRGRGVRLTKEEFAKLSVEMSPSEYQHMVPEPGNFLLELARAQWRKQVPVSQHNIGIITYISGKADTMLGRSQFLTQALWHGFENVREFNRVRVGGGASGDWLIKNALPGGPGEISSSHFGSMERFDIMLELLEKKNGFTL